MTVFKNFYNVTRSDSFRIVPIGCTHCGNMAAEEHQPKLKALIAEIVADPYAYTILMGDAAEFINTRDKRFDAASLASWISVPDLVDLAKVQKEYYLDELIHPLAKANKILAITSGNHEEAIKRYSERDVYSEIVSTIKGWQGMKASEKLGVGMTGWLLLRFAEEAEGEKCKGSRIIKVNLHHGFVGGRLDGAKALNMQRWLWSHDADVAMMGHSHDIKVLPGAIERLNIRTGKSEIQNRLGLITGNWLGRAAYASDMGYFPLPVGYTELRLWPRTQGMKKMSASAVTL